MSTSPSLSITSAEPSSLNVAKVTIALNECDTILPLLRSDYYACASIEVDASNSAVGVRFLTKVTRVLTKEGSISLLVQNEPSPLTFQYLETFKKTLKVLGFVSAEQNGNSLTFTKNKQIINVKAITENVPATANVSITSPTVTSNIKMLPMGFKYTSDTIEQTELLKNESLSMAVPKTDANCVTKPRACANCSCGRKDANVVKIDGTGDIVGGKGTQDTTKTLPQSSCGKCYLGDSFRCASCPYAGLPAFKQEQMVKINTGGVIKLDL